MFVLVKDSCSPTTGSSKFINLNCVSYVFINDVKKEIPADAYRPARTEAAYEVKLTLYDNTTISLDGEQAKSFVDAFNKNASMSHS